MLLDGQIEMAYGVVQSDNTISLMQQKMNQFCDIYVQPSRHEGYCITLAEARVFTSPIVATNFVGAKEQLTNRNNGIVTGFSEEEIATSIIKAFKFNRDSSSNKEFKTDIKKLLALINY